MFEFEFQGKKYHIDDRLKRYIDKVVIPDLRRKDKDAVFIVDGKERIGKSVFSQGFMAYCAFCLQKDFTLANICMTPIELREKIQHAEKNTCIIYDEAHRGMASSRALSEINNILKDLFMEMGQRNLLILVVLPSFFLLDKYAALFRSRGLLHIYENKGRRGYWCYFNEKNKLKLYLKGKKEFNYHGAGAWPHARGRFYNEYAVDEESYRAKKATSFTEVPKITKQEHFKQQRDTFAYMTCNELDLSIAKLTKLSHKYKLKLTQGGIREIIDAAKVELDGIPAGIPK